MKTTRSHFGMVGKINLATKRNAIAYLTGR